MATKKRLIIEGDIATMEIVDENAPDDVRIRRSRAKVQDVLAELQKQEGALEFLPPIPFGHIIARKTKGDRSVVAMQLPPAVRSFWYTPDNRQYEVAFPYMLIVVHFSGESIGYQYLYYSNTPIASLDDELSFSNMLNVYSDARICTGKEPIPVGVPIQEKMAAVVQAFFAAHFNDHEIGDNWNPSKKIEGHPKSFYEWEEKSKNDPSFIMKIDWRSAGKTLRQVLEGGV